MAFIAHQNKLSQINKCSNPSYSQMVNPLTPPTRNYKLKPAVQQRSQALKLVDPTGKVWGP